MAMSLFNASRVYPIRTLRSPRGAGRGACLLFAVLAIILIGLPVAQSPAQAQEANPPGSVEQAPGKGESLPFVREQYLAAFDQVWQTIRDTHWDAELIERVWLPAREQYRSRLEHAGSRAEATAILKELLLELKQSHFEIIPADVYAASEKAEAMGGEGWNGLTFRSVENRFTVTQVEPDSPASKAGVEVGWVLQQVRPAGEEKPLTAAEMIELADKLCQVRGYRPEYARSLISMSTTTGEIGQKYEMSFLDNRDGEQNVVLQLAKGPGNAAKLGNLPLIYVNFEYRKLPDHVGYIRFNAFLDAPRLIKEYEAALRDEHNSRGVILDMRGNIGGLVFLAMGMSGWFVDAPHSLGKMQSKANTMKLTLNPRKPRYDKPVAILVDECSVSCAELFPGGLQELKAARIFGSRTAGQLIPAQVVKLPTGDGFLHAISSLESESGYVWEGNGVQPDEPVVLTRSLLQRDPDPVLSAARKWIAGEAGK